MDAIAQVCISSLLSDFLIKLRFTWMCSVVVALQSTLRFIFCSFSFTMSANRQFVCASLPFQTGEDFVRCNQSCRSKFRRVWNNYFWFYFYLWFVSAFHFICSFIFSLIKWICVEFFHDNAKKLGISNRRFCRTFCEIEFEALNN